MRNGLFVISWERAWTLLILEVFRHYIRGPSRSEKDLHPCRWDERIQALVNEDTWCFLGCANWETFVADTKCFWTKSETFLCPGHKICVRNKCCARGQTGKHLCRQQCVGNNVSSFARALIRRNPSQNAAFFTKSEHTMKLIPSFHGLC